MKRTLFLALCLLLFACSSAPTQVPVSTPTEQSNEDVEMQAAFQGARDTLDTFIQRIGTPQMDRTLVAVKVRFVLPDGSSQDIWVDRISYRDGVFHGTMGDDIPQLKLFIDDKVTIAREDIVDWMVVEHGKLIGGYTIRLAYQRMSSEEKERFLKAIDYSIED